MSDRVRALHLILSELGIDDSIDTVDQRLTIQKAIYLVQTKVGLGYSYGWYLKGPYSPRLTRDYYDLAAVEDRGTLSGSLKESVTKALKEIRNLISTKPQQASLSHWVELLASLHYLRECSGYTPEEAAAKIQETKPHLTPYINDGFSALNL